MVPAAVCVPVARLWWRFAVPPPLRAVEWLDTATVPDMGSISPSVQQPVLRPASAIDRGVAGRSAAAHAETCADRDVAARWRFGAAGEMRTAAVLSRLERRWRRHRRCIVLHDRIVPGSRANIDHVVVGPSGVWVLDTKAWSGVMVRTEHSTSVGGRSLTDTFASAVGVSLRVRDLLRCAGFSSVEVTAAVCFDSRSTPARRVAGVVEGSVPALRRLMGRPGALSHDEVVAVAAHLSQVLPPYPSR